MQQLSTKERLLNAGERLFAEKGIKETSIRDITTAADVHLAAVNYHFGSKDGLIHAVIKRRIEPLNEERLRLLDNYQSRHGEDPVPPKLILRALMTPCIELCLDNPYFVRFAGQIVSDPDKDIYRIFVSEFGEVFSRFKDALSSSLPDFPDEELMWRMHFLCGAMIHTWTNHTGLEQLSGGVCTLTDKHETIERLISFCAAGLRAPLP